MADKFLISNSTSPYVQKITSWLTRKSHDEAIFIRIHNY